MRRGKKSGKVRVVARAQLPTKFGRFEVLGLEGRKTEEQAVVILHGNPRNGRAPLVRIHSQCLTGDVFTSERCDCRAQLEYSLRKIAKEPAGALYEFAAEALKSLGIRSVRLLSNNPDKVKQLEEGGVHVEKRVPCRPRTSNHSRRYLRTKKDKLGHILAGL